MSSNVVPFPEPTDVDGEQAMVAPDGYRLTDVGNAQRFIEVAKGHVRHVHGWDKWIVYQRGRWVVDGNNSLVIEVAKGVAGVLLKQAANPRLSVEDRQKLFRAALKAESATGLGAMVRVARGIPGVLVDHEDLDADPYLLNVSNGTIDLRTGVLRPHDPDDLYTLQAPVDYDPDAEAPRWRECIERWQPDPEVRDYLQREAGAGATGVPTETLDVHIGDGANGKSTFFGALRRVLGPYAVVPHPSLLVVAREQHPTEVAKLFRTRLAVAAETSAGASLNEAQVKNLTGRDRLSGRRMREDPWEFDPSHTLCLVSNHRPTVHGDDEGIWRRVRLIPWGVTIPEDERDQNLDDKLAAEASGILRWVVEGARRFVGQGLTPPESILVTTTAYRSEQDTVSRFLTEWRITITGDAHDRVRNDDLIPRHNKFCRDEGIADPQRPTASENAHWLRVTHRLKSKGAKPHRDHQGRYWTGVRLDP